jgi:phytoene dehydrogenase-like protein
MVGTSRAGSSSDGFDAVVVGSGPNGLVGALCLARAGRRVLLVEAADRIGGALRTEELTLPGFRHDIGATVLPLTLASPAFRELALSSDDVRFCHPELPVAHPLDGDAVLVHRELDRTARGLGRDGGAWRVLVGATAAAGAPLIDALLSPLSPGRAARAPAALARYGISGLLPAAALARAAFRDEPARALFAGMAGHSVLSLRQPVTAGYATLLAALAHAVGWPVVQGGTEQLAVALGARLRALGGEVHTSTRVSDLRELPSAPVVLLDLNPAQVLALGGTELPSRYRRRLARYRRGPGVFKIDWALDEGVPWRDERVAGAGTVHLGGTVAEITQAEAAVARGGHPERPYVICVQPSRADPSRAPEGKATLWAYCHVPNGSPLDMTAAIEGQLERYAPGFRERVLARHVFSPAALERFDANLVGGDLGGGAADLRQFIARPVLSPRPWATPVPGLFLCSASTPPGGGVHGMGGWHAARLALRADPTG